MPANLYKRVLIKLSGEQIGGEAGSGFNAKAIDEIVDQIYEVKKAGVEIGLVFGGGNIFRGRNHKNYRALDQVTADHIGMLSTVINGMFFQDMLEERGYKVRLMSALELPHIAETYIRRRALRHLEKGRILIFCAGIGNPFFSTDTTAALRAQEINAEIVIKATMVDGVYDQDPLKNKTAKKYDFLDYQTVLTQELGVMDLTAITLCKECNLPIGIVNIKQPHSLLKFIQGEPLGTKILNKIPVHKN